MQTVFIRRIFLIVVVVPGFVLHSVILFSLSWTLKKGDHNVSSTSTGKSSADLCALVPNNASLVTEEMNCSNVFGGNLSHICMQRNYSKTSKHDGGLAEDFKNCSSFFASRKYKTAPNSEEEKDFRIAFSISMHHDVSQLERLLQLIYWPQNSYCIHLDRHRRDTDTHKAVTALSRCFPNVFMTESEHVYWAGYGVLKAVLNCAKDSLKRNSEWKYFINIAAQDFPLKTNLELVRILKIFNGSNDVEMKPEIQFNRYWFSHVEVKNTDGIPVSHFPDFRKSKLPVPHGLRVFKGNLAAALSRKFLQFLFTDPRTLDFTEWLKDTDTADEHLWSTINHNSVLKAPGGYAAECGKGSNRTKSWVSRFVKWRQDGTPCFGMYVRDVCVMGLGDIGELAKRPELFANKLYPDFQSHAYNCLEKWYREKERRNRVEIVPEFYQNLDAVRYHNNQRKCPKDQNEEGKYYQISSQYFQVKLQDYVKSSVVEYKKL